MNKTKPLIILLTLILLVGGCGVKTKKRPKGISRKAVAEVINTNLDKINNCYESALQTDPGIEGKIVVEFVISLTGDVSNIKIKSSTIENDDLKSCIKSEILKWKFSKPNKKPALVTYPFGFDVN